jgi:hypothetical protein
MDRVMTFVAKPVDNVLGGGVPSTYLRIYYGLNPRSRMTC